MRKTVVMLVLVALIAVSAGACGGKKKSSTTTNPLSNLFGSSTTSGGSTDNTDVTTGNKKIDALIKKSKTATYKVTYKSTGGGNDSTITIVQDPPRSAFISDGSAIYETKDGKTVSCDGTGPDATCTEMGLGGNFVQTMLTGFFGAFAAILVSAASDSTGAFGMTDTSEKQVAGRDALCGTIEPGKALGIPNVGKYTGCIDAETGVLLQSKTEASGESQEIVATEYDGSPSDADLDPPTTPSTIPGLSG